MAQYPATSPVTNLTVNPNKLVTKQSTAGQALYAATGTTTTAGTTFGSWVQVTASTASEIYITGITVKEISAGVDARDLPVLVDVGIGGAGSEAVVASFALGGATSTTAVGIYLTAHATLPIPVRVASGTRVAVRSCKTANSSGATISPAITIHYTVFTNVEGN